MRAIRLAVILAIAMAAAGCSTLTVRYPVGTTAGLSLDPALLGTWKGHFLPKEGETEAPKVAFYLHFVRVHAARMVAVWVAPDINQEGEGFAAIYDVTTTRLGDSRYINAVMLGDRKGRSEIGGPMVLLYRFDTDGTLWLLGMDYDKAKAAVSTHAITGVIEHDGKKGSLSEHEDVEITADPLELDRFMTKPEAAQLFVPFMVLKKIE